MKKINKVLLLTFILIITASIYFLINVSITGDERFVNFKETLIKSKKHREFIKKFFFPYKLITQQEQEILKQEQLLNTILPQMELNIKEYGNDISISVSSIELSNNKTLKKYKLLSGFYAGLNNKLPGSGYIDFYENNIFILSSRGVLAFRKNLSDDEVSFKQIQNNINDFIGIDQFKKTRGISLKDILIFNNQIFVSYHEEIKEDCWNTSIIYGDINYKNIEFKRLFSAKECIHSDINHVDNIDNTFNPYSSGGRIIGFDENHILFSVGEYINRYLAQDKESVNGKIIKININNSEYEIISMGHRNPQGLYFDKENNFILETEHGPEGGDEINLIEIEDVNKDKIPNYGWPISSYGEHYGGKDMLKNRKSYEKYPFYKSHVDYGFIEPLKAFVPSIAISEIVKIETNSYVLSSMGRKERDGDKSLYFFELNDEKKIINLKQVKVFERIRDLRFYENKLYLFMEDSASIGVINLNEN